MGGGRVCTSSEKRLVFLHTAPVVCVCTTPAVHSFSLPPCYFHIPMPALRSVLLLRMSMPEEYREGITRAIGDIQFPFFHRW